MLYYVRAVNDTMLVALSDIAPKQAEPTNTTIEKVEKFLNYAASHQDAIFTYLSGDMILACHSDAYYLR